MMEVWEERGGMELSWRKGGEWMDCVCHAALQPTGAEWPGVQSQAMGLCAFFQQVQLCGHSMVGGGWDWAESMFLPQWIIAAIKLSDACCAKGHDSYGWGKGDVAKGKQHYWSPPLCCRSFKFQRMPATTLWRKQRLRESKLCVPGLYS